MSNRTSIRRSLFTEISASFSLIEQTLDKRIIYLEEVYAHLLDRAFKFFRCHLIFLFIIMLILSISLIYIIQSPYESQVELYHSLHENDLRRNTTDLSTKISEIKYLKYDLEYKKTLCGTKRTAGCLSIAKSLTELIPNLANMESNLYNIKAAISKEVMERNLRRAAKIHAIYTTIAFNVFGSLIAWPLSKCLEAKLHKDNSDKL